MGGMKLEITDERRADLLSWLSDFYRKEFDEELSEFCAEQLLDFFICRLGPSVYNQAIQDARKFLHDKMEELDAEFLCPTRRRGAVRENRGQQPSEPRAEALG